MAAPAFPSRVEFKRLAGAGHGRALLAMRRWNEAGRALPAWVAGVVRWACLRDRAFDRQCEGMRWSYLSELLQALGPAADSVTPGLWAALRRSRPGRPLGGYDYSQLMGLAAYWVELRDDAVARSAVLESFARWAKRQVYEGDWTLPYMSGQEGYRLLLETVARNGDGPWAGLDWRPRGWHRTAEEKLGKRAAREVVREAVAEWPQLTTLLGDLPARLRIPGCARGAPDTDTGESFPGDTNVRKLSYAKFRPILLAAVESARIEHQGTMPEQGPRLRIKSEPPAWLWTRTASKMDLRAAARDLAAASDPFEQYAYLAVFAGTAYPGDCSDLIPLLDSPHYRIVYCAYRALSHIEHADVRAVALRGLQSDEWAASATSLLVENGKRGDTAMLRDLLIRRRGDRDFSHYVAQSAIDVAEAGAYHALEHLKKHRDPRVERDIARTERRAALALAVTIYDLTPCGICRMRAYYLLMRQGWLDGELRAERRCDSEVLG